MKGILDRLRLSYPDRSGKEAEQVLGILNLFVILAGGLLVAFGVILHPKTTGTSIFSSSDST